MRQQILNDGNKNISMKEILKKQKEQQKKEDKQRNEEAKMKQKKEKKELTDEAKRRNYIKQIGKFIDSDFADDRLFILDYISK